MVQYVEFLGFWHCKIHCIINGGLKKFGCIAMKELSQIKELFNVSNAHYKDMTVMRPFDFCNESQWIWRLVFVHYQILHKIKICLLEIHLKYHLQNDCNFVQTSVNMLQTLKEGIHFLVPLSKFSLKKLQSVSLQMLSKLGCFSLMLVAIFSACNFLDYRDSCLVTVMFGLL